MDDKLNKKLSEISIEIFKLGDRNLFRCLGICETIKDSLKSVLLKPNDSGGIKPSVS